MVKFGASGGYLFHLMVQVSIQPADHARSLVLRILARLMAVWRLSCGLASRYSRRSAVKYSPYQ